MVPVFLVDYQLVLLVEQFITVRTPEIWGWDLVKFTQMSPKAVSFFIFLAKEFTLVIQ